MKSGKARARGSWACGSGAFRRSLELLAADPSIDALLDSGSPFMELSSLAGQDVYPDPLPGAGLVTGIGTSLWSWLGVDGRYCRGAEVHGDRQ